MFGKYQAVVVNRAVSDAFYGCDFPDSSTANDENESLKLAGKNNAELNFVLNQFADFD